VLVVGLEEVEVGLLDALADLPVHQQLCGTIKGQGECTSEGLSCCGSFSAVFSSYLLFIHLKG
jgi:hypothetical protein